MTKIVFYTVFAFAFLIGGAMVLLGIFPFRLFYLAPIAFLILPIYGFSIGNVEKAFFIFLCVIVASAFQNHVSVGQFMGFLRFIGIPYAMYYLCKNYISENNIKKIISICILVACIQPPLVFAQQTFFDQINAVLPAHTRYAEEDRIDFSFGTFYVSNDPSLSFFLIGLIIFLLFDNANNQFVKNRFVLAGYFTFGVLLSNSQLSNMMVVLVWGAFLFRKFKMKDFIRSLVIITIAFGLLLSLGFYDFLKWKFTDFVEQLSVESIQAASGSNFEDGKYERTAAIYYYLNQPLKIIGDGPSAYYDALNREFTLGNTGQVFTFYAEVGLVGLMVGYMILFVMSKQYGASRSMATGCFLVLSILTITCFVLSDTSLLLAYCIFLKTNLVSIGESKLEQEKELMMTPASA